MQREMSRSMVYDIAISRKSFQEMKKKIAENETNNWSPTLELEVDWVQDNIQT